MNKILLVGLLLASSLSVFAQKNVTGKNVNSSLFSGAPDLRGLYGEVISSENPCRIPGKSGNSLRNTMRFKLKDMNVAIGDVFVGVTSEGDIASVTNDGSGPVMTLSICSREIIENGVGELLGNPIVNKSFNCQVDEISSAMVEMPSKYGASLYLRFRPIYFSGSSLCSGASFGEEYSNSERNSSKDLEIEDANKSSDSVNKQ